ncbi:intraflagellar transport protein 22 [Chloropicon primus]|nr:intraflagellar transport protein 22 [Chloropicon primus]
MSSSGGKGTNVLKVCVVGHKGSGKTVLCKLLAEQVFSASSSREYQPTAGLRVQEFDFLHKGVQRQVQLWDCSGDPTYEKYFRVMAKGTQGVLLVHNASKDQEADLEVFYRIFAQPNKLTMAQVATIGTTFTGGNGQQQQAVPLQRKLKTLDHFQVDLGQLVGKQNTGKAMALLRPKFETIVDTVFG